MCIHKTADGTCTKLSGGGTVEYCVEGPCPDDTPTNADRIRSMSDEELAEFIQIPFCDLIPGKCGGACHDCTLDWLKQPAEEG